MDLNETIKLYVEEHFKSETDLIKSLIREAFEVALQSKDERKIGAVIYDLCSGLVSAKGFNQPIPNLEINNITLHEGNKNLYTIHAEAYAIANIKLPNKIKDRKLIMIVVGKFPCICCAKSIIASGITELWTPPIDTNSKWSDENRRALDLFTISGVTLKISNQLKGVELGLTCHSKYEE